MLSLDGSGRVIHSSSFSKTVSPGVRVGYLAGPEEEITKLAKRANEVYISPNMLAESVVWELCRSGALDENIAFVKGALRERRDALVEALSEHLPEAEFVVPGGGYFLWLTLNDDVNCEELLAAALQQRVAFIAGCDFMLEGGRSSLRLSFASVPAEQIGEGVGRIATALEGASRRQPGLRAIAADRSPNFYPGVTSRSESDATVRSTGKRPAMEVPQVQEVGRDDSDHDGRRHPEARCGERAQCRRAAFLRSGVGRPRARSLGEAPSVLDAFPRPGAVSPPAPDLRRALSLSQRP